MSNEALAWAWSQPIEGEAKFLLVALADQSGAKEDLEPHLHTCWPGQERLASMIGRSVRTVERYLKRLEDLGLIRRERRNTSDGWRTSDLYYLNLRASIGGAPDPVESQPDNVSGRPNPTTVQPPANPTTVQGLPDTAVGAIGTSFLRTQSRNPKRKTPGTVVVDSAFEEFWETYGLKVEKVAARKAWATATRDTDPAAIVDGARRYAAWLDARGSRGFQKHPTTWLNRRCWEDELPAATGVPGHETKLQQRTRRVGQMFEELGLLDTTPPKELEQ